MGEISDLIRKLSLDTKVGAADSLTKNPSGKHTIIQSMVLTGRKKEFGFRIAGIYRFYPESGEAIISPRGIYYHNGQQETFLQSFRDLDDFLYQAVAAQLKSNTSLKLKEVVLAFEANYSSSHLGSEVTSAYDLFPQLVTEFLQTIQEYHSWTSRFRWQSQDEKMKELFFDLSQMFERKGLRFKRY
ncbi:MAG: hypothetical protein V2A62_02070 [Candidatus Woesearchaeota archaeon]